ncbi:MAG: sugar transferase [Cyclobacteriaceae bacterium]
MKRSERIAKRSFDIVSSTIGLVLFSWIIILGAFLARLDTGKGFFRQRRVGRNGKTFNILKLRSMRDGKPGQTNVTTSNDPRISSVGRILRNYKLDELPQLWNVLIGKMSMVGPRPDVLGFADKLKGDERIILTIRPGITGAASYYFRNEEELLANQKDPESYNDHFIWPQKVKINIDYIKQYSFWYDIKLIFATVTPIFRKSINKRLVNILKAYEG